MEKIDLNKLVCSLLRGRSHGDCLCVEDLELALEYQGLEYRDGRLSRIWVPYAGDLCRPKNGKGSNIRLCSREGIGFSFVEVAGGVACGNISLYELKRDYELVERRNDAGDIVEGFAKKMVEGEQPIPPDIQEIVNDHFYEMLGDEETESVFNIGDWLVWKDAIWPHGPFVVVSDYQDGFLKAQMQDGSDFFIVNAGFVRKWTIQDAKPGDVLSYVTDEGDLWLMIYQSLYKPYEGHVHYHALLRNNNLTGQGTCVISIDDAKPATKEQCDLLFRKIAEEGFEWNSGTEDMPKKK